MFLSHLHLDQRENFTFAVAFTQSKRILTLIPPCSFEQRNTGLFKAKPYAYRFLAILIMNTYF